MPPTRNRKHRATQQPKTPRAPKRRRRSRPEQQFLHESDSLIFLGSVECEPPPVVDLTENPAVPEVAEVALETGNVVDTENETVSERNLSRVEEPEPEAGCSGRGAGMEKEPEAESRPETEGQPEDGRSSSIERSNSERNFEFYE